MAGTNKLLIRGGQVYDHDGDNLTRPHPRHEDFSRSLKVTASGQHQAMSYENGCSISELQPRRLLAHLSLYAFANGASWSAVPKQRVDEQGQPVLRSSERERP
jgi:hypothetical protein